MEAHIVFLALGFISFWLGLFHTGRAFEALGDKGWSYAIRGFVFLVAGWAFLFASLALGAPFALAETSQEWGVVGLGVMAHIGSSLGLGYIYEKKKSG